MLYVLYNNVCSKLLLYSVGKKLLKLVQTPINVDLQKIDVSSALLFLLMEMSKNDILLSFSSLQVNLILRWRELMYQTIFFNVIFLFKHYKDIVHISTVKLWFKLWWTILKPFTFIIYNKQVG